MLEPCKPHDYGSQKQDTGDRKIDVQQCFTDSPTVSAPDLSSQLEVFQQLMALGDVVAKCSEAWICVSDAEGPGHETAIKMAELCQKALDARKLATQIEADQMQVVEKTRRDYPLPSWRLGRTRDSTGTSGRISSKCQSCGDHLLYCDSDLHMFHIFSSGYFAQKVVRADRRYG